MSIQFRSLAIRAAVFGASLILATGISIGQVTLPGVDYLAIAIARSTAFALSIVNTPAALNGAVISADGFVAIVSAECTAIEILLVFSAAVAVWPVPLRAKLLAMLVLVPALLALNLVRVTSLMLAGIGFPEHFDVIHLKVWQPAMVLAAMAMWLLWQRWAIGKERSG